MADEEQSYMPARLLRPGQCWPRLCSAPALRVEGLRDPICLLEVLLVTFLKILKPSPLFADTLFQLKVCVA